MASQKIPPVTNEQIEKFHPDNRDIMESFIEDIKPTKSDKTIKQYISGLQIFFRWVHDHAKNKPIHKLKKRDALKYQNYLLNLGLSSNAVSFKRSVVSSLCNYIEMYYEDEEEYETFRNIFKGVENPVKALVHEKKYILEDDWKRIIKTLTEKEEWQVLAFLQLAYATGARKGELIQIRKDVTDQPKAPIYETHSVRGKGRGKQGKAIDSLKFDQTAMDAMLKWLEVRGEDECEYLFVNKVKRTGEVHQLDPDTFNTWMSNKVQPLVDYRVYPHILRKTRATHLANQGVSAEDIADLLNHESSETTNAHYIVKKKSKSINTIFGVSEEDEKKEDGKE